MFRSTRELYDFKNIHLVPYKPKAGQTESLAVATRRRIKLKLRSDNFLREANKKKWVQRKDADLNPEQVLAPIDPASQPKEEHVFRKKKVTNNNCKMFPSKSKKLSKNQSMHSKQKPKATKKQVKIYKEGSTLIGTNYILRGSKLVRRPKSADGFKGKETAVKRWEGILKLTEDKIALPIKKKVLNGKTSPLTDTDNRENAAVFIQKWLRKKAQGNAQASLQGGCERVLFQGASANTTTQRGNFKVTRKLSDDKYSHKMNGTSSKQNRFESICEPITNPNSNTKIVRPFSAPMKGRQRGKYCTSPPKPIKHSHGIYRFRINNQVSTIADDCNGEDLSIYTENEGFNEILLHRKPNSRGNTFRWADETCSKTYALCQYSPIGIKQRDNKTNTESQIVSILKRQRDSQTDLTEQFNPTSQAGTADYFNIIAPETEPGVLDCDSQGSFDDDSFDSFYDDDTDYLLNANTERNAGVWRSATSAQEHWERLYSFKI